MKTKNSEHWLPKSAYLNKKNEYTNQDAQFLLEGALEHMKSEFNHGHKEVIPGRICRFNERIYVTVQEGKERSECHVVYCLNGSLQYVGWGPDPRLLIVEYDLRMIQEELRQLDA